MSKQQGGTLAQKRSVAEALRGGVILDVTTPDEAKIAEDAGAIAVMALERVPADIRAAGGVARMADPEIVFKIREAVNLPVMAKCRIGHFAEAQVLESLGVQFIDESEVLTPADDRYHIQKDRFDTPFVCGARNLGEALRRIAEGAAMMRTKGEPGTGDIIEAVRHMRTMQDQIRHVASLGTDQLMTLAKEWGAPYDLIRELHDTKQLPVVNFAAGGIATPADAALMMQLGADGIFVGSGVFKSSDPVRTAQAIVEATAHYQDPDVLARVSRGLGEAMSGRTATELLPQERMAERTS